MSFRHNRLYLFGLTLGSLACGGTEPEDTPAQPASIRVVAGDAQTGTAGAPLASPIVVAVLDETGSPLGGGWLVNFAVTDGGGTVSPASLRVDQNGLAQAQWIIGPTAGSPNKLIVSAEADDDVRVTATATGIAGAAAQVSITGGDLQTADLSTVLDTLTVRVADHHGNAVRGQEIIWSATTGIVRAVDPLSDSLGLSRAVWTSGTLAGSQSANATIAGAPTSASFTATVRPGSAVGVAIHSGDQQTWAPSSRLIDPLSAKVVDQYGNGVTGISVTWQVVSGGGTLAQATSVSDSIGLARTNFTLGSALGSHTVSAQAPATGGSPVIFAATASASAGATVSGVITRHTPYRPLFPGPSAAPGPQPSVVTRNLPPQQPDTELLVRFRASALGVPAPGSVAPTRTAAERTRPIIAARLANAERGGLVTVAGISPALLTARVLVSAPHSISGIRNRLLRDPSIESVELNSRFVLEEDGSTNRAPLLEPMYPFQAWHYGMVDLPDAWQIATGSNSVLVAVIDDGIRFDHPAIAANLTNDGYDFVSGYTIPLCDGSTTDHTGDFNSYDPDPTAPMAYVYTSAKCYTPHSQGNHGLHVAGTIGAVGNDGVGVTGLNWNVRIRPVRALGTDGSGTEYDIAQAVLYAAGLPADDGQGGVVQAPSAARILNMSLAGPVASPVLRDAIQLAQGQDVLVVASTGNLGSGSPPLYPASFAGVFAIASVDAVGWVAGYSSRSPYVSMSAPGGSSVLPNGNTSGGVMSLVYDFINNVPGYGFKRGTSMAAPHAAGAAALILSTDPSLTADQLKSRLRNYSIDLGTPGWDQDYGAGVLNVRNSLTQSFPPAADIYVRLVDTTTGRQVAETRANPDGSYSLNAVPDGAYYLLAGEDFNGDGRIGLGGRRFAALTHQPFAAPTRLDWLSISGSPAYAASMVMGYGLPNQFGKAFVNGYIDDYVGPASQRDYALRVPNAGRHTIETVAPKRACGLAEMGDPLLELWNSAGTVLIANNDDIDPAAYDYCARIQMDLQAGDYIIRLKGKSTGDVKLEIREGD